MWNVKIVFRCSLIYYVFGALSPLFVGSRDCFLCYKAHWHDVVQARPGTATWVSEFFFQRLIWLHFFSPLSVHIHTKKSGMGAHRRLAARAPIYQYFRGQVSLRGPRRDGGHYWIVYWWTILSQRTVRRGVLLNLCYGPSIPRASVARSRGSFPPTWPVGSNRSGLRACISLYAGRPKLRLLQYGTNSKYFTLRELKFTVLSSGIPPGFWFENRDEKTG